MNLTQSPPYSYGKTAFTGLFRASNGVSCTFPTIYFRGGLKPKDFYNHLSKSIASSFDSLLIHLNGTIGRKEIINTSSYHHRNGKEREKAK